jgi:tetratricopeptide (TPR) repeat protein
MSLPAFGPFILAVVVLTATPPAAAQQPGPGPSAEDVDDSLTRAIELHKAGDLMGAIQNYQVALDLAPDRADIRSNLAAALVALGRYDEGIAEYTRALTVRDDSQIRLNLGLALYKSRRRADAIAEFRRVLDVDPGNKQASLLLADCLLQDDQYQAVIDLLGPRDADFRDDLAFAYLLGTAYLNVNDVSRGQVLIDRIFQPGESAEGRLLMGMAYISKQDYPNAVKELARAAELKPELPSVQLLYGRALLGVSERDKAMRAFRAAVAQDPDDFDANLQLGNMYRLDQKLDQAMTYLKRASALRPNDLSLRHLMAATHLGLGEPEQALALLEPVVREAPDFIDGHVLLATTYYRLKRKDDAERERAIVTRLTAEAQSKQPGAQPPGSVAPIPTGGSPSPQD